MAKNAVRLWRTALQDLNELHEQENNSNSAECTGIPSLNHRIAHIKRLLSDVSQEASAHTAWKSIINELMVSSSRCRASQLY
jgi:hypothetical protein